MIYTFCLFLFKIVIACVALKIKGENFGALLSGFFLNPYFTFHYQKIINN
uniref:Uncharacterized protein n=1 Tax=Rhizophora mucronata TaxID=61149 RepID=A0A2P2KNA8_RHIMU